MIRLGLTGSIGMGKSTVARMFAEEGVPVFDADAAVHTLQGPGGALVDAIEARFPGTTGAQGVDRAALAARVLGAPDELRALEALIHPAVARMRADFIAAHADAAVVLFDIPLLYETGGEAGMDKVAVVSAPASVQRARVLARPGMTAARLDAILARQLPDDEKCARADFVIPTGGTIEETRAAVRRILACLGEAPDS
jgi:dephospho-CoA kinase